MKGANFVVLGLRLFSHLVEHELNDKAKSGWIETHENEEVHYHSYHSIGSQLLQPTKWMIEDREIGTYLAK